MTAPVVIRRDEDGLVAVVEPCLGGCAGRCDLHGRQERIVTLPAPFSVEALAVARRLQDSSGVVGFVTLDALARAWYAEHTDRRAA